MVVKSFYDPTVKPKDYTIKYIGHDLTGLIYVLPKGLYYWHAQGTKLDDHFGYVKPARNNKYAKENFDTHVVNQQRSWICLNNPTIKWNIQKIKNIHPTKEIADIFTSLK